MPIEGPEAEKAMEAAKSAREKEKEGGGKEKKKKDDDAPKKKVEDEKDKEGLRGGTGAAGPLFSLPGSEPKE